MFFPFRFFLSISIPYKNFKFFKKLLYKKEDYGMIHMDNSNEKQEQET